MNDNDANTVFIAVWEEIDPEVFRNMFDFYESAILETMKIICSSVNGERVSSENPLGAAVPSHSSRCRSAVNKKLKVLSKPRLSSIYTNVQLTSYHKYKYLINYRFELIQKLLFVVTLF